MNHSHCSACNNKLVNLGIIPDGTLFKCRYCGSKKIYIENNNLKKDEVGYGNSYRERISNTKISDLISLFERYFFNSANQIELLDVGFGSGEFLMAMSRKGLLVSGLECDSNSMKIISRQGIDSHLGELGGEMNLKNKYDLVTLWDVLEHISNIEKAMAQLNSITKKNGKVFILTPNANSLFDTLANLERRLTFYKSQKIINICLNRYHLHRFSVKGLKILLERFGFSIEHIELLQLFSLRSDEYIDGFAPGILRWTNNSAFNRFFSKSAMSLFKIMNIRNKIFITAIKKQFSFE